MSRDAAYSLSYTVLQTMWICIN